MNDEDAKKYDEFTIDQRTVGAAPALNPPNPKQRYGDMKSAMQLVPPALTIGAARALKEGAAKYGAYNWRNSKVELMTYLGAIQRHEAAIRDGEDVDPESKTGKLHIDGIAACAAIILDAYHGGFLIDNRPPKGPAPDLLRLPKDDDIDPDWGLDERELVDEWKSWAKERQ